MAPTKLRSAGQPWSFILVTFFVVLVVFATGFTYYYYQRAQLKTLTRNNLTVVANLKVDQIENWLKERRNDAEIIHDNSVFFVPLFSWLSGTRSPELEQKIKKWMAALCGDIGYSGIALLDRQGNTTIYYLKAGEEDFDYEPNKREESMRDNRVIFGDFHRDIKGVIKLDMYIPIQDHGSGLLVLRINPKLFLYPLIQTWPVPSETGETLLVRREGNEIVFLNELRHKKGTALKLRFPVNTSDLPAALTVRGINGLISGKDYNGHSVLAIGRPVPGTNWYIVSKIDTSEIYLSMIWIGVRASALGALVIVLLGAGVYFVASRQSAAALALQNYYLKKSQELALVGSWDLNIKTGVLIWTAETYNIFGVTPGTPLSYEKFLGLTHPDDREKVNNAWQAALAHQGYDIEHRVIINGEVKWVREKAELQFDEKGNAIRAIGAVVDITEYKRLVSIRDEFVNTVSHELRTPMAIIHEGVAQVIEGIHGPVNEGQNRFLSTTLRSIDRLGRIINNLLDISRLESGKMEAKKDEVDFAQLAREIAATFRPQIEKKGLELIEHVPDGQIKICADRDELIEVLTNLLGNALKFTDKGRIELSVVERANEIECAVADTGRGIAADKLPKLFEKFTQFGRIAGAGEKGTGLGLAIAKSLIELHDGKIYVESVEGRGMNITFTLPKNL